MTLVEFAPDGDDASTTTINGVRFSIDALNNFHYALYSNKTISNNSNCYLVFDRFQPNMLDNGTWIHATTCYIPFFGISTRGKTSIVFGVLFGLSIMFTLMNLKKHGAQFLREDKRFRLVGRRWQWYWMLFVAACAMISLFTGVDVDRYYLQQMPIVLQSFFFTLMVPASLAMVWEGTRHWGSWQERQVVDGDPYGMPQDDRRTKVEFWSPLVFYLFAWLNFFMVIPRSWTPIQKQNTPEQSKYIAQPAATNNRGKAGAVLAVCAWFVIVFSLQHSLRVYKQGKIRDCPKRLVTNIVLLGVRLGYGVASAWDWDLSIYRQDVMIGWPFGLGYAPLLLIIIVYNVAGLMEQNEDKQLIAQRVARGRVQDAELNIVKKPSWWSRSLAARFANDDQRLRNMAAEVGGGRPTARNLGRAVEMGNMNVRQRSASRPAEDPFRDESPEGGRGTGTGSGNGSHLQAARSGAARGASDQASVRTESTGQTLTPQTAGTVGQQRIISMLDV
ncbi:hypothetical protein N0V90_010260 [Kalmusia sp. IMI 367209]|nr:hypothetical protein N0V90_010260 [Kalmusia sp. IMI 367209]